MSSLSVLNKYYKITTSQLIHTKQREKTNRRENMAIFSKSPTYMFTWYYFHLGRVCCHLACYYLQCSIWRRHFWFIWFNSQLLPAAYSTTVAILICTELHKPAILVRLFSFERKQLLIKAPEIVSAKLLLIIIGQMLALLNITSCKNPNSCLSINHPEIYSHSSS